MAGRLTTHVLDTARGAAAAQLSVDLFRLDASGARTHLASTITNEDGRTAAPPLAGDAFTRGTYELVFHVGAYFRRHGMTGDPLFLESVPVRFGIAHADEHYHVPLLVSPFAYSTYRGG
jgi:5-hydroxyisourate hydrolase